MSAENLTGLATAFDEMLNRNRKELDQLFGTRRSRAAAGASPSRLDSASETARLLNSRYGRGWRFEVVERRREGDEVVVVGKLSIPGQNLSQTQSGRSRIRGSGKVTEIQGTADGIPFTVQLDDPQSAHLGSGEEEAAFRRAREAAAANCAQRL